MTAVAAQAQAWQRRMRNRQGPLGTVTGPTGGSGEQPTGIPQVELYIGGWIDVTALGLVRYPQRITVTRGQPDENQKTNPSSARFRLANLDGRFSPRDPLGLYYGLIEKNTPCRISVQSGNVKNYRFYGEIASWPQAWDPTGNDKWVDVEAAGLLRRLGGTGGIPLRSAPFLYWANPYAGSGAIAYWPMEDKSGATQFASAVAGGIPMSITGSPTLSTFSTITASDPLPNFTTGSGAAGRIPFYTPALGSSSASSMTCYVAVASGGETSQTLIQFGTTGSLAWELYYVSTSGGQLGVQARNSAGTLVLQSTTVPISVNGVPVVVGIDFQQLDANNVVATLNVQVVATGVQNSVQVSGGTYTMGRLTTVKVAPAATLTGTTIGHLAIATASSGAPFADYAGHLGEQVAYRFQRLCNLANIPSHIVWNSPNGDLGPAMGPQHSGKLLDLLQECVDADQGIMFELMDQVGLGYRMRDTIVNQTAPVATLDYAQAQLSDVPTPVDDDQFLRNDVTAQRLNGSFTRAEQVTGTLNIQNPPLGVGDYPTSITVNVQTDAQTADQAGWRLHLGTVAEPRFPNLGVQLARQQITGSPVLRPNLLAVMPGDRISVVNPPSPPLAPDPISALVIGYTESFDQFLHHIQFNTTPESPWRVAVSDDPVLGRADTDGSTLAAPAGPTDPTIQVATTNSGAPLWTTNAADWPFDIAVGGERMTVTAVTGGTSPQTLTVTRSVNGVVKAQTQNTNVQLYQPATVSM